MRQDATLPKRYRLERAGIHNVWQYDNHVFEFADGRLLLRGRNGAGKSKALEMLLPFLLDGDARRLDTTGTSRTSLRWLMLEGRTATETGTAAATESDTATLGYLWIEFVRRGEDGRPQYRTLGAAVIAVPDQPEARAVFFVTDRRVGDDLVLIDGDRPLSVERLRSAVGPDNCYDTALGYRTRVMRELFGLDDPMRYRNLIHLLYRLRRPTVGERLEAGELASVLSEALPPMDDTVLDQVARNITDLESARSRLAALRTVHERTTEFLADYRGYLHGVLRRQAETVRAQITAFEERDTELARLESELDSLVSAESSIQVERDRLARSRDTAASDAATLHASTERPAGGVTDGEREARYAAAAAYIRAAEAAWVAGEHARSAEAQAHHRLDTDTAAIERGIGGLRRLHLGLRDTARAGGIDPASLGEVPQPVRVTLAPRESTTQVNLEGLEQPVERPPVLGIEIVGLRRRLAELHDRLSGADAAAAEREAIAEDLYRRALELEAAERREADLNSEAEWADSHAERARARERAAIEKVREASADYAADVREWCNALRAAAPDADIEAELEALEQSVEPPLDDAFRVLPATLPETVARRAHAIVEPLLEQVREARDAALGEERDLAAELDELTERRADETTPVTAPRPFWATAPRDPDAGIPLYLAVDFAERLTAEERAGLEAALEASGLLAGLITPDGTVVDQDTHDLLLSPVEPLRGRTLLDVLVPLETVGATKVDRGTVIAILSSIRLRDEEQEQNQPEHSWFQSTTGPRRRPENYVSLDGRWRLGVAQGRHHKAAAEYIGEAARAQALERHRAKAERRIEMAEALLAEAQERRAGIDNRHESLLRINRSVPSGAALTAAWAVLDDARAWLAEAVRDHAAARAAADAARATALSLRGALVGPALEHRLPAQYEELARIRGSLGALRVQIAAAHRDLEILAGRLEDYRRHVADWQRAREARIVAEDAAGAAISDMITVRRETELTDRAGAADPAQVRAAIEQVRARAREAGEALPALEREAQRARDERVAAETRHGAAAVERAEQARRALAAGARLRALLATPSGEVDRGLLAAAGLTDLAAPEGPIADYDAAEADPERSDDFTKRIQSLDALVSAVEAGLDPADSDVDDSGILHSHEELHRSLAAAPAVGARTELTEPAGVKRVTVHDDRGAHDIVDYAERLSEAIAEAEETAAVREEEAYERHLLGELAGHLSRQITEARELIDAMNSVLGEVTTSQGLGVRLEWQLAPDADEDIRAVVPLLSRPADTRTRVEATRLRDALRRCIEAIRRLDPTVTGGAQLRAALDYRSWFAFTVYVTDAAHPERERRLTHRTALSQGEQRVIAYLVLFAAAAAQFTALALDAPQTPRLILLDDAFAKVDEPTHGRLLGMLVELDLDFVLTSERVWGCFPSVPRLNIYECLRDPAEPGIATLHFTWDGNRRRLNGV
ncbi:TIGR02680 family protein [Thermobifida cellulosilytica]|uniref:Exonuclease SbcC n=1 Tax=Thermobifida cellulosilytica TB100 TaxID=665004 RepID=A0A147KL88_THECS|nr:TIGR02680 family protein [Thermobifida cellulosilytica]KUP98084.1 exonuclease SbcC [Thermobifida cellulosilytica TB100]